jgi:signal transduction histidine kinase
MLRADRNLLQQVMINLVRNGLDALENVDNPKLEISSQTKKGSIRISVTDNGAGIDEDILDEVFVPFYTTKPQGSGIGLSLARQVMRMHGGNIQITSRKGEGTRVYLDFQG